MKLTKSQKQLIMLGVVVATTISVAAAFLVRPSGVTTIIGVYTPPTVDTNISKRLLLIPEYRKLTLPISLPLIPGQTGRPNPFDPYQ